MTKSQKEIIFLNRAYNDLDIQLSLIHAFAEDKQFKVRVIGYPCDGDVGNPGTHEARDYIQDQYRVSFETIFDDKNAPVFFKLLHKAERFFFGLKQKSTDTPFFFFAKALHILALLPLRKILSGKTPWLEKITETWNPSIFILDEVIAQKGRSYLMDVLIRKKAKEGTPLYAIKTGHDTYLDPQPNKQASQTISYHKTPLKRFIFPSEIDTVGAKLFYPDESIEIHGNLRMDPSWVSLLHNNILAPPYLDKESILSKLPQDRPRVVFMLSKLGYGIKLEELKDTIKAVANISGISCAVKPHTRSMKFNFMDPGEIANVAIVPDIPSTLLIEWSDILLFTGSSIAFHAIVLGKKVGFLQNCQYIKTIFDDGTVCEKIDNIPQIVSYLEKWRDSGRAPQRRKNMKDIKEWQTRYIYGGVEGGYTAQHYKSLILEDLELDTATNKVA